MRYIGRYERTGIQLMWLFFWPILLPYVFVRALFSIAHQLECARKEFLK